MDWIVEILEDDNPAYGYQKLTIGLRHRHQLTINKKKFYRLCQEMELLWPQRQRKTRHPRHLPRNWVITRPNQLWQTDIKYGYVMGYFSKSFQKMWRTGWTFSRPSAGLRHSSANPYG